MLMFLCAEVVEKALIINGQVVSNHDLARIKKLYKVFKKLNMPVPDGGNAELYFYKKIFFEYMTKFNPMPFLKVSEEDFQNYFKVQLMQLNIDEEKFRKILDEYKVSFKECRGFMIDTLRWYRFVAMNFQGLIKPSEAAINEFMIKINSQIKEGPSLFVNGYIVQIKKEGGSFIDEININAMVSAKDKDEFLKVANNYSMEPLNQVPIEAVTQPIIKSSLEDSYSSGKPVVCAAFDDVTLVVYVTEGHKMKRGVSKEQATQMLSEEIVIKKCGDSFIKQVSKKLKIQDGKNK